MNIAKHFLTTIHVVNSKKNYCCCFDTTYRRAGWMTDHMIIDEHFWLFSDTRLNIIATCVLIHKFLVHRRK